MLPTYRYPRFCNSRPAEIGQLIDRPVLVVGAGPVGLSCAIDLAQRGVPVLLLDEDDTVSVGSRGLCYAKRTLEILDRLGVAGQVLRKGVSWNVGRTFFADQEIYRFELLAELDHGLPGMVNLQQYYLEQFLVERAMQIPLLEMRCKNRVAAIDLGDPQRPLLRVETPEGDYLVCAQWVVVADGARSPIRRQLGLDVEGQVFRDRFLIADVVMKADFPTERWFWFDPPFHPNQSVLLHRQADEVWRIDFQLGWDVDPEEEKKPARVIPRIQAMLGPEHPFDLEWISVYTFQCRRMRSFRHGRVLFAGDAAHQVSPFGARGANSGVQDADNLGWKLAAVLRGQAPHQLLESYDQERGFAADENLHNSTRSTDFITPKSSVSRMFRDAVLLLSRDFAFARALVNSGRLSVPSFLLDSPLNTPDGPNDRFDGRMRPGAPADDAPILLQDLPLAADGAAPCWLLQLLGEGFVIMVYAPDESAVVPAMLACSEAAMEASLRLLIVTGASRSAVGQSVRLGPQGPAVERIADVREQIVRRYDLRPGTAYLFRPDQHVLARWRVPTCEQILAAHRRGLGIAATPIASRGERAAQNEGSACH